VSFAVRVNVTPSVYEAAGLTSVISSVVQLTPVAVYPLTVPEPAPALLASIVFDAM
jgi:hypothetical protein